MRAESQRYCRNHRNQRRPCDLCRLAAQKYREAQSAKGLCYDCRSPAVPGKRSCERHVQQQARRLAESRAKLSAAGICLDCKEAPARPERKTCARCGELAVAQNRRYFRKRVRRGLCGYGACPNPAQPKQTLCAQHLRASSIYSARHYGERLAAGLCRDCGKNPRMYGDAARCVLCRERSGRRNILPSKIRRIIRQFWRLDRIDARRALAESVLSYIPKERDRQIIRMRHGLDDGIDHILEDVGEQFGITRERVRQIESRAYRIIERYGINIDELRKPSETQRPKALSKRHVPKRKRIKERAGQLLREAIKAGEIHRRPCQKCGALRAYAHHHDYSKPYDVVWLCPRHHAEAHGKKIAEPKQKRERAHSEKRKEYTIPCWLAKAKPSSEFYDAPSIVDTLARMWIKQQQVTDITGLSYRKVRMIINGQQVDDKSLATMLRYIESIKQLRVA